MAFLLFQGWYIVTYALGIYHLNLFIAFLSPKVDPSLMEDSGTVGAVGVLSRLLCASAFFLGQSMGLGTFGPGLAVFICACDVWIRMNLFIRLLIKPCAALKRFTLYLHFA